MTVGRLGQIYDLSPATLNGLAKISGEQAPPPEPPAGDVGPEKADDGSFGYGNPYSDPAARGPKPTSFWDDESTTPRTPSGTTKYDAHGYAIMPGEQTAEPAKVQGPAVDTFPTVKTAQASAPGVGQMAVGPSYAVPAHWQPGTQSQSRQGMILDPQQQEQAAYNRDIAQGHGLIAADKKLEAAQQAGMADALYASAQQMAAKQAQDKIAAIDQRKQDYESAQREKLAQLSAETHRTVDPNALWKERGTAAQVGAAIMIGLGQFATMASGRGSNAALQIVNDAIDRNIAAQRANIDNAHRNLDEAQNLYARNLAAFGDEKQAIMATKAQYLEQVAAMANVQRAKAGITEAEAGQHDFIRGIYDQAAKANDDAAKAGAIQFGEQSNQHFIPATRVGPGGGEKGKEALYVPTLGGYARDEATAKKLNEKGALRMQIGENMRQIHGLMEESKGLSSTTPDGYIRLRQIDDQIKQLTNDALTKNTVLEGQGAMSESDKEVAAQAKAMKDISVAWSPNFMISRRQENLKKAAIGALEQHRLEGEAYGVQKGGEQYVRDANGNIVSVRQLHGRNASPSKNTQAVDDLVQPPKGESGR